MPPDPVPCRPCTLTKIRSAPPHSPAQPLDGRLSTAGEGTAGRTSLTSEDETINREKLLKAGIWLATAPLPKSTRKRLRLKGRSGIELARCRRADAIILSRAKSGRTWLRAMISACYHERYGLPDNLLLEFDNLHRLDRRVPKVSFAHGHALADAFETPGHELWQEDKPLVFLIRNPCDVAVSEYFQSTRRASAYKREMWGVDTAAPMFDFVMSGPVGLPVIVHYMNTVARRIAELPSAITVRYEDMRTAPESELARVVAHIDSPFDPEQIERAVEQCRFDAMKRKEKENFYHNSRLAARDPDDPDSYKVRRAKVGGYRDYFDADQVQAMERYVTDHLDPCLGYAFGSQ